MKDLIIAVINLVWLIISNTYALPFIITGVVMFISKHFGIWYGKQGGKRLFAIISIILEIVFNWQVILRLFK